MLTATIEVESGADFVGAKVTAGGHVFCTKLATLQPKALVNRVPAPISPFYQQGLESAATKAQFWVDDVEIPLLIPPQGITGGPAAVSAPCGLYAR